MDILLASASPRRKELLEKLGLPFTIAPADIDENIEEENPTVFVETLSRKKALALIKDYPSHLIIGSDTIVCLNQKILGKPKNRKEAKEILSKLSSQWHQVYTGVTLLYRGKKTTFTQVTQVKMFSLSDVEIEEYLDTGESMDKAGAYGIQNKGALLVEEIKGDYFNVVGLPIGRLWREIKKLED